MICDTKLAEMLATRLCHDLTGPIGAVNNGVEFLEEDGFDMQNEAVQLILTSAHDAVNRLMFYRQAYGRVGDTGEANLADKKKLVVDFFSRTKVTIDWPDSHTDAAGIPIGQKMSRLMLNLFLIVGASLIRGGTLSARLQKSDTGDKQFLLTAVGETIKLDAEIIAVLRGETDAVPLSPKTAQPYLTLKLAEESGASMFIRLEAGTLEVIATQRQPAVVSA